MEMKKFFALLSVAAALTIAVGCGKSEPPKPAAAPAAATEAPAEDPAAAPVEPAAEEPAK
jgi:hypothetical protein